jgi:hypothetical protein
MILRVRRIPEEQTGCHAIYVVFVLPPPQNVRYSAVVTARYLAGTRRVRLFWA